MSFLEVRSLTKKYFNAESPALNNVSLSFYAGEIFSLLGVNGAGKTTFSSLLATLHPCTSGDILYRGESIYKNIALYRSKLGFCPQKPNLDRCLNVANNLLFAGRYFGIAENVVQQRAEYLLKKFDLKKYAAYSIDSLSGGYQQRLLIARALMHDPEIIIFDEPTVGLDPDVRRHVWDIIKKLKDEGKTIILTTHYLDEAEQLSDRICILDKGHLVLIASVSDIKIKVQKNTLEEAFLHIVGQHQQQGIVV